MQRSKRDRGQSEADSSQKPSALPVETKASDQTKKSRPLQQRPAARHEETVEELDFEDDFDDEIDEEDEELQKRGDKSESDKKAKNKAKKERAKLKKKAAKEEARAEQIAAEQAKHKQVVWSPDVEPLKEDEQLDYDSSAYMTYHKFTLDWPCLSFDILRDTLGEHRNKYPLTMYLAAGTQAARQNQNKVYLLKLADIHKTHDDDNEEREDEGDDLDEDATTETRFFNHSGGAVNRIRSCPQNPNIIATWGENGLVRLWNASAHIAALDRPPAQPVSVNIKPDFSLDHKTEGFALAWSGVKAGRLVTGDCNGKIYLTDPQGSGWAKAMEFKGHAQSVEDLQFAPNSQDVFASCSVDKTIRLWDSRASNAPKMFVAAHHSDVNVIAWNAAQPHLILSGSDDCSHKVWDIRNFKSNSPYGHFKFHKQQITSVEWLPGDESTFAVSSADNTVSFWDLSLEEDKEEDKNAVGAAAVNPMPPQLLFHHMGQRNPKELHFHPQIPGLVLSTAEDGFNLFKPISLDPDQDAQIEEMKNLSIKEQDEVATAEEEAEVLAKTGPLSDVEEDEEEDEEGDDDEEDDEDEDEEIA